MSSQKTLMKETESLDLSEDDKKVLDKDQREDLRETIKLRCTIVGVTTIILMVLAINRLNIVKSESEIGASVFLGCSSISVFITVMITTIKLLFSDVQLLKLSDVQKFELAMSDMNYSKIFMALKAALLANMIIILVTMVIRFIQPNFGIVSDNERVATILMLSSFVLGGVAEIQCHHKSWFFVQRMIIATTIFLFTLGFLYI